MKQNRGKRGEGNKSQALNIEKIPRAVWEEVVLRRIGIYRRKLREATK
jgi:hypothetical protein